MDYATLVASKTTAGSIANWLNSASLVSSAPTIVEEAESFVYRRLRHWRMLAETTGTMTVGQDYIAISAFTNYLEDKTLKIQGLVASNGNVYNQRITRKTPEQVKAKYQYDSTGTRVNQTPMIFYNNGTQFKFDSPPDVLYPYELLFYQQPTALVTSLTNWLTIFYPKLFRHALMVGAAEFMKDAGLGAYDRTYYEGLAEKEIAIAQAESDRQQRSIVTDIEFT